MSFRVRVFVLVAVVALGATGATAALVLRQAGNQVREAAAASAETTGLIASTLTQWAVRTGTWEGVHQPVQELSGRTGERIRLVSSYGQVVVDTDEGNGRVPRASGPVVAIVDPTPVLVLDDPDADPHAVTLKAIRDFRYEVDLATCLYQEGLPVQVVSGTDGVPRHLPLSGYRLGDTGCVPRLDEPILEERDRAAVEECDQDTPAMVRDCLVSVFRQRVTTETAAPPPLTLALGVGDEPIRYLDAGPILLITAVVAVLVTGGALLISRRVLKPIGALTTAALSLGSGDRFGRVPDTARDELGELARAFNQMADSVRAAEADQRRLIADVAHELRTPLANLRGYLEAMQDGVLDPTPELFASLHDEVIHNQRIVDDLQELALAEAGALVYHRAPTDLAELLETVRTAFRADLSVEADGPLVADVDADRIRQAVSNLTGNALRATESGGSVTLRARAEGDRAVLEVADTGTGIAPEHLPLVFDRLWRADPARGRESGGSGLGLAIVRQIVRDHGGEISVASTPGEGSTFTITLPLTQRDTSDLSRGASGLST